MRDQWVNPTINRKLSNEIEIPKVIFIFYEYFFKAVVRDGHWKQCFAENERLGTNVSEAFAHAIIENKQLCRMVV
jgi:hypothetical protein